MMNRNGNLDGYDARCFTRALSLTAALVVGCGSEVDLGGSVSPPDPVTDEHELAAQTTNLATVDARDFSSIAIDEEFLYFGSFGFSSGRTLRRCRKSDCWTTLVTIAGAGAGDEYDPVLSLNAGRLGWANGMCDAPDCTNRVSFGFPIWDERFGYWFNGPDGAIYRCDMADCFAGTGDRTFWRGSLVASRAQPTDLTLAGSHLYWLDLIEGMTRASVDGSTPSERLSLGNVTEWTSSRARLQLDGDGDVTIIDMEVDGAYIYAALNVGTQNANATLRCDTCTPGIAIARWLHATPGAAREWVLMNDADLTGLSHLRVFGGELIWGTENGSLYSCLANRCSGSKHQIGVLDATSTVAPFPPVDRSRADLLPPESQFIAVDQQDIYWLSVPCNPVRFECSPTGSGNWTLKRTPRLAQ